MDILPMKTSGSWLFPPGPPSVRLAPKGMATAHAVEFAEAPQCKLFIRQGKTADNSREG